MRRLSLALTCLTLLPLAAAAAAAAEDCPASPEDAAQGLRVDYVDGSSSVFTLDPGTGMVAETWTQAGGIFSNNRLDAGVHLVSTETPAQGEEPAFSTAYTFDGPLPATFAAGQVWTIGYRLEGAGDDWTGTYGGTVGAATDLAIGPCRYDILPITLMMKESGFTSLVRVDYIPALKLSILGAYGELLGTTTTVTPVSIARAGQP